jgi:hypothetical protein
MNNTKDEILDLFVKELKKYASDIVVPAPWEPVKDEDDANRPLPAGSGPVPPPAPQIEDKGEQISEPEESPMETVPQETEEFSPQQEERPISQRDDSTAIIKRYRLSDAGRHNADRIKSHEQYIDTTKIYEGLDFEDLFGETLSDDPLGKDPEYQAKHNTKHFLTSNTATYRGMKRDPEIVGLIDTVIDYYIANDPGILFQWNVFKPHGGYALREKYYGPAVISYLNRDPAGVFQNRLFYDIEFIKMGLLPKLWSDIMVVAMHQGVDSFEGESEAALNVLHKALFEHETEFYKNNIMGKNDDGSPRIELGYFSNKNRISAEKRRQQAIIQREKEKGV